MENFVFNMNKSRYRNRVHGQSICREQRKTAMRASHSFIRIHSKMYLLLFTLFYAIPTRIALEYIEKRTYVRTPQLIYLFRLYIAIGMQQDLNQPSTTTTVDNKFLVESQMFFINRYQDVEYII